MCFVCEKQGKTIELIKPFLKEGVQIQFKQLEEWQEIWITDGNNDVLITADGDDGGYFHFAAEKPEDWDDFVEDDMPDLVNGGGGTGKDFSLTSKLSIKGISSLLPGVALVRGGDKTNYEWHFTYKGNSCGIWDYKGDRWSGSGPKWCFEELGFGPFIE